jgi:protein TonB
MIAVQSSGPGWSAPIALHRPDRRKLSRAATAGIAISVALHAGAFTYLAIRRFVLQPPPVVDGPITEVELFKLPRPEPKPEPQVERPRIERPAVAPRPAETPPPMLNVEPAPFPPSPEPPLPTLDPPVMTADPAPAAAIFAPTPPPAPALIVRPDWLQRPSGAQLTQLYPRRALEREQTGRAVIACTVTAAGRLRGCTVADETPAGAGFGDAALKLSRYFQMRPMTEDGRPVDGGQVRIPVSFDMG